MSFETSLRLLMVASMLGLAIGAWRRSRSPHAALQFRNSFVRRNRAIVEGRFVSTVTKRYQREQLSTVVIAVVALVAALIIPMQVDGAPLPFYAAYNVIIGLIVAARAGLALWDVADPVDLGARPRTARLRAVRVRDLVAPRFRWAGWASVVTVGGLLTWGGQVLDASSAAFASSAVAVGALLSTLVVTEVAAHRVAAAPEPAFDAAHLYWQDALRGETFSRGYLDVVTGSCLLALGWSMTATSADLRFDRLHLGVLVAGVLSSLLWASFYRGQPWFRRRLWPHLGKGEVVVPGRQVAA